MRLGRLLCPPCCCACGRVLLPWERYFCQVCRETLFRVPEPAIRRNLTPELLCVAPLWYQGCIRKAVLRMKFRRYSWVARSLGEMLGEVIGGCCAGEYDCVTWVPVSRRRLRSRGFDQSQIMAAAACRGLGERPVELLRKVVDNPAQSGIQSPVFRRCNVKDAYEAVHPERFRGRRVLLVDDVCTTGATLTECARVLLEAGAADVLAVTLAKSRRRGRQRCRCGGYSQGNGTILRRLFTKLACIRRKQSV